jgi:hypothetical protein
MLDLQEHRALVDAAIPPGLTFMICETAKIMGRHPGWVRQRLNDGTIKSIWLGKRRVVPRSAVVDALTRGT